jgi:hypothetical protein
MVVADNFIAHRAARYEPDDIEHVGAGVRCGKARDGAGTAIRSGPAPEA